MDCIIPGPSVRTFCAAITCLSRIGKDLYAEFAPLEGLVIKTLNDAKSAYCCFHFKPTFFEKCSSPMVVGKKRSKDDRNDDEAEIKFTCRVPLRAMSAIVKSRRGVVSLRIRNEMSADHLLWSFEFKISNGIEGGSYLKVIHRLGVAEAEGVCAVASRDGCSEIVSQPKILLRMLEHIKQSDEMALIVNDKHKLATAASFHHSDNPNNNALVMAASHRILKTETTIGCDEFDEFEFRDYKPDNDDEDDELPPNVNEEVTLVFGLKDAKAMLTFCSAAGNQNVFVDEEPGSLRVTLQFHYGGRPLILETSASSFTAELILATLDHKLLGGLHKPSKNNQANINNSGSRD